MILYTIKDQDEVADLMTNEDYYARPHEIDPDNTEFYKTYGYGWIKRKMGIDHYPVWFYTRYPRQRFHSKIYLFIVKYDTKDQPVFITRFGPWHELLVWYHHDKMRDLKRYDREIIVPLDKAERIIAKQYKVDHPQYHVKELQVCVPFMKLENVISIKPYKNSKVI